MGTSLGGTTRGILGGFSGRVLSFRIVISDNIKQLHNIWASTKVLKYFYLPLCLQNRSNILTERQLYTLEIIFFIETLDKIWMKISKPEKKKGTEKCFI